MLEDTYKANDGDDITWRPRLPRKRGIAMIFQRGLGGGGEEVTLCRGDGTHQMVTSFSSSVLVVCSLKNSLQGGDRHPRNSPLEKKLCPKNKPREITTNPDDMGFACFYSLKHYLITSIHVCYFSSQETKMQTKLLVNGSMTTKTDKLHC